MARKVNLDTGINIGVDDQASAKLKTIGKNARGMADNFGKANALLGAFGAASGETGRVVSEVGDKVLQLGASLATGGPLGIAVAGVTALVSAGALAWAAYNTRAEEAEKSAQIASDGLRELQSVVAGVKKQTDAARTALINFGKSAGEITVEGAEQAAAALDLQIEKERAASAELTRRAKIMEEVESSTRGLTGSMRERAIELRLQSRGVEALTQAERQEAAQRAQSIALLEEAAQANRDRAQDAANLLVLEEIQKEEDEKAAKLKALRAQRERELALAERERAQQLIEVQRQEILGELQLIDLDVKSEEEGRERIAQRLELRLQAAELSKNAELERIRAIQTADVELLQLQKRLTAERLAEEGKLAREKETLAKKTLDEQKKALEDLRRENEATIRNIVNTGISGFTQLLDAYFQLQRQREEINARFKETETQTERDISLAKRLEIRARGRSENEALALELEANEIRRQASVDLERAKIQAAEESSAAQSQMIANLTLSFIKFLAQQLGAFLVTEATKRIANKITATEKVVQDTATTTSGAISAHSGIPFVGIALGIAAAAAGVAAILAAKKFQRGGEVPGAGTGDIVPALLEPGEVVIPRQMVRDIRRVFTTPGGGPGGPGAGSRGFQQGGSVSGAQRGSQGFGSVTLNLTVTQTIPDTSAGVRKGIREAAKQLKDLKRLGMA